MMNDYLAYLSARRSPNTVKAYEIDVKQFLDYTERKGIDILEVEPSDVDNYINTLGTLAKSSMSRKIHTLSSYFSFLKKQKVRLDNPVDEVESVRVPRRKPDYLTKDEIEKIRNYCGLDYAAIVEFMLSSGVRVSELCSLDIKNVDFERREALVFGKGGKERHVIYSEYTAHLLRTYLNMRSDDCPALFVNTRGNRLTTDRVYYRVVKIGKAALHRPIYPHIFRHTFATHLSQNGFPLVDIQQALGHEDIKTTVVYTHPSQTFRDNYDKAMEQLS